MFELDSRLKNDTIDLGRLKLSRLLLMNNGHLPWFILVPEVSSVVEIIDLSSEQQYVLLQESAALSRVLKNSFAPCKLNIAAIGNVVSQLHLHHVVRYENDLVWPAPVWGNIPAKPYTDSELNAMTARVNRDIVLPEMA